MLPELAGPYNAGRFCRLCDAEIEANDMVFVDADADWDDDGWRDRTMVWHEVCPPDDDEESHS